MNQSNTGKLIMTSIIISLIAGCGEGTNLASVEGTVTMDGKPLPNATVVFVNSQSRPSAARTDANGFYRLSYTERELGAVPGKNIVRVSTVQGVGLNEDGSSIPGVKESVPMKYNVQTTLTYDVQPKVKNVANWDLDSKGAVLKSSD